MLDKNAFKILGIIASMTVEGENLVVEQSELLERTGDLTSEELDSNMEALEVNDMINILYSDAGLYCVSLLPKGKLVSEKNKREAATPVAIPEETDGEAFTEALPVKPVFDYKKLALICAGSSFGGGFIAAIIAFLIARFA